MNSDYMIKSQRREDLKQLQFFRFFAFLHIFLWHAHFWVFWKNPGQNGSLSAVNFFFILSGVLSGLNGFGKEIHLSFYETASYIWKKIKKFYPLYFLTTVFMLLISDIPQALMTGNPSAAGESIKQFIFNCALIQSWFSTGYFTFNSVGWFLSTIMFLYLFSKPTIYLLNIIKSKTHNYVQVYTAILIFLFAITAFYCYLTKDGNAEFWQYIFPPARLSEYIAGIVFGFILVSLKLKKEFDGKPILFTILELLSIFSWIVSLFLPSAAWTDNIVKWLLPNFALIGIFAFGKGYISSLLRWKIFVRLGDISFECFLVHYIVITLCSIFWGGITDTRLYCLLSLMFSLFVTVLSAHLFCKKRPG